MTTMRRRVLGAALAAVLAVAGGAVPAGASGPVSTDMKGVGVMPMMTNAGMTWSVHLAGIGWRTDIPGTTGQSRAIEAVRITVPAGTTLCAQAHVQNQGWRSIVCGGPGVTLQVGTTGQGLPLEALNLWSSGRQIQAQAHVAKVGWQATQSTTRSKQKITVGTTGRGLAIESLWLSARAAY